MSSNDTKHSDTLKMDPVKPAFLLAGLLLALGTNGGRLHQPVEEEDDGGSRTGRPTSGSSSRSVLLLHKLHYSRSVVVDDEKDAMYNYAVYDSYSKDTKRNGLMATMGVYGFSNLSRDQETAAAIWVGNRPSQDYILVGWHVKPSIYGDSRTRFFTYWTKDGFLATGCYNTACPGFQLEADTRTFPGDVIDPVSESSGRRQNITIKVYKEDQTGDWWVYYGFNSNPTAVGKFPKSLLTGLSDSVADFAFGGYTYNPRTQLTPPMGSGSSLTASAASFSGLQYILQDGTVSAIAGELPSRVDSRCYTVTPIENGKFFYGGPGGCSAS